MKYIILFTAIALSACSQHSMHMMLHPESTVQITAHGHCMVLTNLTEDVQAFVPLDEEPWTEWGFGTRSTSEGQEIIKAEACL